eukprot:6923_1
MRKMFYIILFIFAVIPSNTINKPNIIFLLVDDLGWNNVGFHALNNETKTPNIDRLATEEGLQLNRHYVHYVCCPTRTSFQTGRLPVHVNIVNCGDQCSSQSGAPENMTLIAKKMKQAGYSTHMIGKWHVGMATPTHTPKGRGYDKSLIYFEATVNYFTQVSDQCNTQNISAVDLWSNGGPAYKLNNTDYVDLIFAKHIYDILDNYTLNYNDNSAPLFLVYTPHIVHAPLMVPKDKLIFNFNNDESNCSNDSPYVYPGFTGTFHCRSIYHSMVSLLDEIIGNITSKLKQNPAIWNNTLIVFSTDNGGPLDINHGAGNNNPLRGGKHSVFEGGIRGAAFVSGGYLPLNRRGEIENGMIHISDWYSTFSSMVNVNPFDNNALEHNLPPVDGYDVWPLIIGETEISPRSIIPIDNTTLIMNNYKYIYAPAPKKIVDASWEGIQYPNDTTSDHLVQSAKMDCSKGCLFDVVADMTEHVDIGKDNPDIVQSMHNTLNELKKSYYD